jgi:hypothetical protein
MSKNNRNKKEKSKMTDMEKLMTLILSASPLMVRTGIEIFEGREGCEKPQKWLNSRAAMDHAGGIGRSTLWLWRTKLGLISHRIGGRRLFLALAMGKEFVQIVKNRLLK